MESQTDMALDLLNRIINATVTDVEKFEAFNLHTALQSLYIALDLHLP